LIKIAKLTSLAKHYIYGRQRRLQQPNLEANLIATNSIPRYMAVVWAYAAIDGEYNYMIKGKYNKEQREKEATQLAIWNRK